MNCRQWCVAWLLCSAVIGGAGGCFTSSAPPPAATGSGGSAANSPPAEAAVAATDLLRDVVAAYRAADAYHDAAVVRISYRQGVETQHVSAPFAVAFQRPNKLRLRAYQATVASDGEQLFAQLSDDSAPELSRQVLTREAPEQLKLPDIYGASVLSEVMAAGSARYPVQLELLLDAEPLASALADDAVRRLLDDAPLDGVACRRVEVVTAAGARFVFWIDPREKLVRRIEFPTDHLEPQFDPDQPVEDLRLIADFDGAAFAAPPADTFAFTPPADAQQVRFFVKPPLPLPTTLFGRRPEPFTLTRLDGAAVGREQLADRITVLMWFNDHPAGQGAIEQLAAAQRQLAARSTVIAGAVDFYAVCAEPSSVSNDAVRRLLAGWQVDLPVVRDLSHAGRDVFQMAVWPTTIVLDRAGRVQLYEPGYNDVFLEQLPEILESLVAGENLAEQILAAHQHEEDQFRRALAAAMSDAPATVIELPVASIAPASTPQNLRLSEAWRQGEIAEPGNLLAIADGDDGQGDNVRIFALDGPRNVVELDAAGQIVARRKLPIPLTAGVSQLRTTVDGQQRRYFLGLATLGRQAYVFDADWSLVGAYPPDDQPHDGLHDALLADLAGDGELELYVALAGGLGVHAATLAGERLWTNRTTPGVLALAAAPPADSEELRLLGATDSGAIAIYQPSGRELRPVSLGSWVIHALSSGPAVRAATTPLAALSFSPQGGSLTVVALDEDLVERWSYQLPPGAHRTPVRTLTPAPVFTAAAGWLIAGPDGSVHLVRDDGEEADFYYTGVELTGLTALRVDGRLLVVAASRTGVVGSWLDEGPAVEQAANDTP